MHTLTHATLSTYTANTATTSKYLKKYKKHSKRLSLEYASNAHQRQSTAQLNTTSNTRTQ